MQDVTIYIETSIHGPARKEGKYIYILECMRDGKPVTREGRGGVEEATENQLVLLALRDALKRLNCRCAVVIYTNAGNIAGAINNRWPEAWKKNGWKNTQGKPVKNAELWKEVTELLECHMYLCDTESHSYSDWLKSQMTDE